MQVQRCQQEVDAYARAPSISKTRVTRRDRCGCPHRALRVLNDEGERALAGARDVLPYVIDFDREACRHARPHERTRPLIGPPRAPRHSGSMSTRLAIDCASHSRRPAALPPRTRTQLTRRSARSLCARACLSARQLYSAPISGCTVPACLELFQRPHPAQPSNLETQSTHLATTFVHLRALLVRAVREGTQVNRTTAPKQHHITGDAVVEWACCQRADA